MKLYQLSACDLAQKIQNGEIRSIEALNACFQQIDRFDHHVKAMITTCRDEAEEQARQADLALTVSHSLGPLHGVPIAIKDLTATAGIRTTYGSLIYQDYIPTQDDLCVARLKAAGAILVGKTNTPEFGMGAQTHNAIFGPTATPYDINLSSGGSSGGSAAAVAAGMAYLAQGTDMGGSVRTPASFCGVVGLRPAAGRIPRPSKPLLWETLVTDGILARTVEDAALMLSVMAGGDRRDPVAMTQPVWNSPNFTPTLCDAIEGKFRVGYSADLGIAVIDQRVRSAFETAIDRMTPLCEAIAPIHPDCGEAQSTFETIRAATICHLYEHHYQRYPHLLSDTVRWNIEQGLDLTAASLLKAEAERSRLHRRFLAFFEHYDILATVSASVLPFPLTQPEVLEIDGIPLRNIIDYLTITYTITLTGLPVLSMPCVWLPSGLPIGIQLVGKPQGEVKLLQFAYLLQERLNFRHQWPYSNFVF
jgi:amidase